MYILYKARYKCKGPNNKAPNNLDPEQRFFIKKPLCA